MFSKSRPSMFQVSRLSLFGSAFFLGSSSWTGSLDDWSGWSGDDCGRGDRSGWSGDDCGRGDCLDRTCSCFGFFVEVRGESTEVKLVNSCRCSLISSWFGWSSCAVDFPAWISFEFGCWTGSVDAEADSFVSPSLSSLFSLFPSFFPLFFFLLEVCFR